MKEQEPKFKIGDRVTSSPIGIVEGFDGVVIDVMGHPYRGDYFYTVLVDGGKQWLRDEDDLMLVAEDA